MRPRGRKCGAFSVCQSGAAAPDLAFFFFLRKKKKKQKEERQRLLKNKKLYSQPGDAGWSRDFFVLQGKKPQEYCMYFKVF